MANNKNKYKYETKLRTPATGWTTKAEIEALLASEVPTKAVTHLSRHDIEVAEQGVFQWRDGKADPHDKARHIAMLMHDLSITKRPLDPLLIFPAGGKYFVIDGHHRLAAYEAVNWDDPIPVEVFGGSLDEACMAALHGNRKAKLPMTQTEKSNAAWRLVREDRLSKQAIADLGLVSRTTVRDMRQKLREIIGAGADPAGMDWDKARRWTPEGTEAFNDGSDWRKQKVEELVQLLIESHVATELSKFPDLMMSAFAAINPELPATLAGYVETDVLEELLDARREDARREDAPFNPHVDASRMHDF
jgi:ParB-like chromosome segregation protein Spo0J